MAARAEVTAAIRERYRASGKAAKSGILDEFVAVTGVHRKHAIRLLSPKGIDRRPRGRPKTRYGRAVAEALVLLWEASDRVCSKCLPVVVRAGALALGARVAKRWPAPATSADRASRPGPSAQRSRRHAP